MPVVGQMAERQRGDPHGKALGPPGLHVDSGEGTDSATLLELSCGQAPKTARATTGGGGVHLYFRCPSPEELWAARLYAREVRNSQGSSRGRPGRARRGRLRRGPAKQHGA